MYLFCSFYYYVRLFSANKRVWFIFRCKTWNNSNCFSFSFLKLIIKYLDANLLSFVLSSKTLVRFSITCYWLSRYNTFVLWRMPLRDCWYQTLFILYLVGYCSSVGLWTRSLRRSWGASETTSLEFFFTSGFIGDAIIRSIGARQTASLGKKFHRSISLLAG